MTFNVILFLCLVFHIFSIQTCYCQNNSPQNIETLYPNETLASPPTNQPPKTQPSFSLPPPPQGLIAPVSKSSSSNGKIAKAVAATAASTIVICGIIFILAKRCLRKRKRSNEIVNNIVVDGDKQQVIVPKGNVFEKIDGNVRGLIVDEDGLDVIYWRKLEEKNSNKDLYKDILNSPKNKEEIEESHEEENQVKKSKSIQEIPLLRGQSSSSHLNEFQEENDLYRVPIIQSQPSKNGVQKHVFQSQPSRNDVVQKQEFQSQPSKNDVVQKQEFQSQPSILPSISAAAPPPAPPPPIPARKSQAPPPPPPIKTSTSNSSSTAISQSNQRNSLEKGVEESNTDQVKLKPLHWDKVNTNAADHSMVWDKVDRGSFKVDQNLMEALFGYVATNRLSPKRTTESTSQSNDPSTKIFILDPRKSQNIAIVLKSLGVSRGEILDALIDGKGLNSDTLEKLSRVSPTAEDKLLILNYREDPSRLAAAESFLYHILKAVPSAFNRLNAMLFRLNYDTEVAEIKECLQTIEFGCKELRSQGVFLKLLEAVLKAGNRMNDGTSRGNAQAFNLNSLRKLNDVKSNNGKTTLLHFVVEEVVLSEGKRAVLNQNNSLNRNNAMSKTTNVVSEERREREYKMLGLSIVGGISSEFSNVKRAANLDYKSLIGSISELSIRLNEIKELVSQCENGERGNFVKEMNYFIGNAEEELKLVREKQTIVLQILSKTTQYYECSKEKEENDLQLFGIVKDFLRMVDQVCIEIAREMQKKNPKGVSGTK
ncbi:formin-like protein 4 [Trifolium pratense]|uniref:formin-like protein 4 n=1 Tax=Trifolium pratense TaxID=57577 RepID=UPI001E6932E6|nr:formin-like protein 4 [Trifolium pratense]